MKKFIIAISGFIILFSFSSCKNTENDLLPEKAARSPDMSLGTSENVVTMTAQKDSYLPNVEAISVTWQNDTDRALRFDEPFCIEKKAEGNKWISVFDGAEADFDTGGIIVFARSRQEHIYRIRPYTGTLEPGEYRIAASFFYYSQSGNYEEYPLYAEFEIVDGYVLDNAYFAVFECLYKMAPPNLTEGKYCAADLSDLQLSGASKAELVKLLQKFCEKHGYALLLEDIDSLDEKGYMYERYSFTDGFLISFWYTNPESNPLTVFAYLWKNSAEIQADFIVEKRNGLWEVTNVTTF